MNFCIKHHPNLVWKILFCQTRVCESVEERAGDHPESPHRGWAGEVLHHGPRGLWLTGDSHWPDHWPHPAVQAVSLSVCLSVALPLISLPLSLSIYLSLFLSLSLLMAIFIPFHVFIGGVTTLLKLSCKRFYLGPCIYLWLCLLTFEDLHQFQ